jgi:uncharacterized protein YceK
MDATAGAPIRSSAKGFARPVVFPRPSAGAQQLRRQAGLVLLALVVLIGAPGCGSIAGLAPLPGNGYYLNHDLSTADLSQWTHRDYGLGTEVGSNQSGAGYIWYHANVQGSRAVGLTATAGAHASPAADSDSVFI